MFALRLAAALFLLPLAAAVALADDAPALKVAAAPAGPVQVWTAAELGKVKAGLKLTWRHETGVSLAGAPLTKTQVLEVTALDGDSLCWQVTREIVSLEAGTIRRDNHVLKLQGSAAEFADEAALRTLPDADQARTSDENLTLAGKAAPCRLVSHSIRDENGVETVQQWWFLKDKPGVCARYERTSGGKVLERLELTGLPD